MRPTTGMLDFLKELAHSGSKPEWIQIRAIMWLIGVSELLLIVGIIQRIF